MSSELEIGNEFVLRFVLANGQSLIESDTLANSVSEITAVLKEINRIGNGRPDLKVYINAPESGSVQLNIQLPENHGWIFTRLCIAFKILPTFLENGFNLKSFENSIEKWNVSETTIVYEDFVNQRKIEIERQYVEEVLNSKKINKNLSRFFKCAYEDAEVKVIELSEKYGDNRPIVKFSRQDLALLITKGRWEKPRLSDLYSILFDLIDKKVKSAKDESVWGKGYFQEIQLLAADLRGELGEEFVEESLLKLGYDVKRPSLTDRTEKHWDIKVNGIKIEIKTATIGRTGRNFQHENIEKDRNYDVLALVDITPDSVYLTVAPKSELPFTEPNNNWTKVPKKMHRRATGILYKWDLTLADVEDRKVESLKDVEEVFANVLSISGRW